MGRLFELFKLWFARLLKGGYATEPQDVSKARTYYRKDLKAAQDLTRYARAFAFEGKDAAFYTDRNGNKKTLEW